MGAAVGRAELGPDTLDRACRGDDDAARQLVDRYQRSVFALVGRMLAVVEADGEGSAQVEDLAQETFLRVFRHLDTFDHDGPARLSTWILGIAARLCIDEIRRRQRQKAASPALRLVGETTAAAVDAERQTVARSELGRTIAVAMNCLSPDQRAALLLRAYHGLSYADIAVAMQTDIGTIKSRISRAKVSLREGLERESHVERP